MGNINKVLLVEDFQIAQKIAKKILTELGYEVDTADNGEQALEQVSKNQYGLIFMDLGLPDVDGISITKTIRETWKNNTVIVALTAHNEPEVKKNCMEIGMNDFLTKPLTTENAKNILDKYLSSYNHITLEAASL